MLKGMLFILTIFFVQLVYMFFIFAFQFGKRLSKLR